MKLNHILIAVGAPGLLALAVIVPVRSKQLYSCDSEAEVKTRYSMVLGQKSAFDSARSWEANSYEGACAPDPEPFTTVKLYIL